MTTALNAEQLRAYIRELDDEYRRNRSAAETLLNNVVRGSSQGLSSHASSTAPLRPTLRSVIRSVMEDRSRTWNSQTMLKRLHEINYEFSAKKPAHRVQNVMSQMDKEGEIFVIVRGTGGIPNEYSLDKSMPSPLLNFNSAKTQ